MPYGLIAIVVLVLFVIVPTVFLLLYPFKFFQRKLSLLRLNDQALQQLWMAFVEVSGMGSAGDRIDARFLAGVFLMFRIFFYHFVFSSLGTYFLMLQNNFILRMCVCLAMAGLILLIRPNKTNLLML